MLRAFRDFFWTASHLVFLFPDRIANRPGQFCGVLTKRFYLGSMNGDTRLDRNESQESKHMRGLSHRGDDPATKGKFASKVSRFHNPSCFIGVLYQKAKAAISDRLC